MTNKHFWRSLPFACGFAALLGFAAHPRVVKGGSQAPPRPIFTPYHASGIYDVGETVGWTVSLPEGVAPPAGRVAYSVRRNNFEPIKSGELDLSSGKATIELPADQPSMVYVQLTLPPSNEADPAPGFRPRRPLVAGAAIAPSKLKPVVARPADFDAFWSAKLADLGRIPMNPELTPGDAGRSDVDFSILKMDHLDGGHIYGQLAEPKAPGKHPALLLLQWASPPYPLQKSWVTDRAAEGWLTLDIEPHDVLPNQPQAYYDALPRELKNYTSIGQEDRDKSYFVRMYLADYRAVEYLAGRPDWDGKTLVVMGTSMGGQQSVCVAGLNRRITHMIVEEPSGCDLNAGLHGRQPGYPSFPLNSPKAMETARYVDAVNFAPKIRAKCLVAMGFLDTIAPPAGIWTAFNLIRSPKVVAPMVNAPHNNTATAEEQRPYTSRAAEWLRALASGHQPTLAAHG
ncbi:MAG TPA: acetylxylan esterase [Fimbriimonadaceae bacterium]|nr:acetylxylan esterase [Fimbriimonadaceae bacterium]